MLSLCVRSSKGANLERRTQGALVRALRHARLPRFTGTRCFARSQVGASLHVFRRSVRVHISLRCVAQIVPVLEYYRQKIRPSTRRDTSDNSFERDVSQRWFERVPGYLREETKRKKVEKALETAFETFAEFRGKFPVQESKMSNLPSHQTRSVGQRISSR